MIYKFQRKGGYECSSKGDKRFSAFNAIMPDGRSIEHHYQCDIKGYDIGGTNWKLGKGKPALDTSKNLQQEYLKLWIIWSRHNKHLIIELKSIVARHGNILSDMFATTAVNQAWALAEILNNPQWLEKTMKKPLRIALIGSRELEKDPKYAKDIPLCYKVAYRCAELQIIFTSGLCELGMDGIAQKAYSQALREKKVTKEHFEVYVAEQKNITRNKLPNKHLAVVRNQALIPKTHELCLEVMGKDHWSRCNEWARGMHSRNCHQILGDDLESPVDAVITWTPNGEFVGGTRTALLLAAKYDIPIFNLGRSDKDKVLKEIAEFFASKGYHK